MQLSTTYTKILWGITLFVLGLNILLLSSSSLIIRFDTDALLITVVLLSTTYLLYFISKKNNVNSKITTGFNVIFFFTFISIVVFYFQYLVFATNLPLFDETYATIDHVLGVNVAHMVEWIRANYFINLVCKIIYNTYYFEFLFVIPYFIFKEQGITLQRFLVMYVLGALLSLLIAGLFPAAGTYAYYNFIPSSHNIGALKQFYELRHGIIDYTTKNGLIVFPSFHALAALIYIYLFRNERKMIFIPLLLLNLAIIFTCMPIGEHYFIDIIGGFAVFFVIVGADHLIFTCVKRYGTLESHHDRLQRQTLSYQKT